MLFTSITSSKTCIMHHPYISVKAFSYDNRYDDCITLATQ